MIGWKSGERNGAVALVCLTSFFDRVFLRLLENVRLCVYSFWSKPLGSTVTVVEFNYNTFTSSAMAAVPDPEAFLASRISLSSWLNELYTII